MNPEVSDELRMCISVAAAAHSASHTRELPESESELNGSNAFCLLESDRNICAEKSDASKCNSKK